MSPMAIYEYIFYSVVTTNFRFLILRRIIIRFYNNIYQISIGRHVIMSIGLKKRSRLKEEDYIIGYAFSIASTSKFADCQQARTISKPIQFDIYIIIFKNVINQVVNLVTDIFTKPFKTRTSQPRVLSTSCKRVGNRTFTFSSTYLASLVLLLN